MSSPATPMHQLGEMKIKPKAHPSFLLGTFTEDNPPKGFSIAIHPDPNPYDSVTTRVVTSGPASHYKLILHVANHGSKTVAVQINQL